jgi:hypothetical protein
MTKTATKTYLVGVIERAVSYFKLEAEDAATAADNWQEGDFWDRDDEALEAEGPCNVREQQPDGTFLMLPRSQWEGNTLTGNDSATRPYSVLLLYPDYADDTGYETYYAFVQASDAIDAVAVAQRQAVAAQIVDIDDPTDFHPLLVTEGHHASQPLFNK